MHTQWLDALLMGIVEGLTEFLPVSSTGHLILLADILKFTGPYVETFEIAIQLGAILAVMWVYRHLLIDLLLRMWRPGLERYYAINLIMAFIPALVIGAALHGVITRLLFSPTVVCVMLVVGGIIIILVERMRHKPTIHSVPEMGPLTAFLIGCGQVLAMIPGTSRSGATIITALLLKVDRKTAAEFSFVLAIPTMIAATVFSLWKARATLDFSGMTEISIGFIAAFLVALVTVRVVLGFIQRTGYTPFGVYRIIFGLIMGAWLIWG